MHVSCICRCNEISHPHGPPEFSTVPYWPHGDSAVVQSGNTKRIRGRRGDAVSKSMALKRARSFSCLIFTLLDLGFSIFDMVMMAVNHLMRSDLDGTRILQTPLALALLLGVI